MVTMSSSWTRKHRHWVVEVEFKPKARALTPTLYYSITLVRKGERSGCQVTESGFQSGKCWAGEVGFRKFFWGHTWSWLGGRWLEGTWGFRGQYSPLASHRRGRGVKTGESVDRVWNIVQVIPCLELKNLVDSVPSHQRGLTTSRLLFLLSLLALHEGWGGFLVCQALTHNEGLEGPPGFS